MSARKVEDNEAFRLELRTWLEANLPPGWTEQPFVPAILDTYEKARFELWWHRKLYEGGWAGAEWPQEYGGRGLSPDQRRVYQEEMARAKAPDPLGFSGLGLLGPTLIAYGTEEQKARFLPKILSGEEIWCQGYSEPNSGSDLASLRTRAVEDGDDFIVNGQKIWTSFAQHAQWCFCLVRTDPNAPKHKGLSYLLIDMRSPGITVRPILLATGEHHFNEVFFDNVRVPKKNLVGELNRGWYVGVTTLAHERGIFADTTPVRQLLDAIVVLAKRTPYRGGRAWDDPIIRRELASGKIRIECLEALGHVVHAAQAVGAAPGAEANMCKLLNAEIRQALTRTAHKFLGPYGVLERGSDRTPDEGHWAYSYVLERSRSIRGGTDEIQLNIIGERGLGLPR
ncbi:MAG TPA: acyl-CoA dehydrogenase family protein [Dehalococcoidia bacterium]|nr:acyl-CoA dehydrogenase family protein [Dehalococcoidia bacterium]